MTNRITVTETTPVNSTRLAVGLTILRVIVGTVFVVHGYDKLFNSGILGVTGFFTQVGAPLPGVTAPLVSILEFGGGIALILGLLTPFVAVLLAADMLGALFLVHLPAGFVVANGGYEFVLTLLGASLALALTGPGAYALDALFGQKRSE